MNRIQTFRLNFQSAAIALIVSLLVGGAGGAVAAPHLFTGKDIKNGSITRSDLAASARPATSSQLRDAVVETVSDPTLGLNITVTGEKGDPGTPGGSGPVGAAGSTGSTGVQGAQGVQGAAGADGTDGAAGSNGQNGQDGLDGANAAVQVMNDGDQGWHLTGSPAAAITGGELRLGGGTDNTTPAEGGIGIAKDLAALPRLSNLTALRYSFHVDSRPVGTEVVPVIHLSLTNVTRTDGSTQNTTLALVGTPADVGVAMTTDALQGQWKSLRPIAGGAENAPQTIAEILDANPQAQVTRVIVDNGGTNTAVDEFAAGVDDVVVGFGDTFDRYDFGG